MGLLVKCVDLRWTVFAGKVGEVDYALYSVGDGVIFQHIPGRMDNEAAVDVNAIIKQSNNIQVSKGTQ